MLFNTVVRAAAKATTVDVVTESDSLSLLLLYQCAPELPKLVNSAWSSENQPSFVTIQQLLSAARLCPQAPVVAETCCYCGCQSFRYD